MASTAVELLRRRFFQNQIIEETWVLISDTTVGGDVITPISYDAQTGYYEVESFPSWFTAEAGGSYQSVLVQVIDFSDISSLPFPTANNSSFINIYKVDDTHFYIQSGQEPKGTPNINAFVLARYTNKTYTQILSVDQSKLISDYDLRIKIDNANTIITKYQYIAINGARNYNNAATFKTDDATALGYESNRKFLGNLIIDCRINAPSATLYTDNIKHQDGIGTSNGITKITYSYDNLDGTNSGSIWGYGPTKSIWIGGWGVCRTDARIQVFTKKYVPKGYTQLLNISSGTTAGSCAVLNTGLIPTDEYWRFIGSWKRTGAMGAAYVEVMSAYTSETANAYRIIRNIAQDNKMLVNAYSVAGGGGTQVTANALNTTYIYDLQYGSLTINGSVNTLGTTSGSDVMSGEMKLGSSQFPMSIGRFKAYHNNELVADMIPCKRNSDNVVGMYDIIRDIFFTSSNTYNFTE